jgi:hypothetical protein
MKHLLQILFLLFTWFTNLSATPVFPKVTLPIYEFSFSKTENVKDESTVKLSLLASDLKVVKSNLKKVVFPPTGTWTPALVSDIKPLLQNGSALFSKSPNIQTEIDNLIAAGIDPEVIKQYLSGLEDISHTDPRFLEVLEDIKSFPNPRTTDKLKSHIETFAKKLKGAGDLFRGITKTQFFETVAEFKIPSNGLLGDQAWDLWKAKKWGELEDLFKTNNINGKWPPNRGFIEFTTEPLSVGKEIDRYGGYIDPADGLFKDNGLFASPKGESFESRALPGEYLTSIPLKPYNRYKVIKEIPNVKQGQAAPWFNQPGMGTQYELPLSIDKLLKERFIVKIN